MSRVYRDMVLRRASRADLDRAHAQAGDMLRILILGSTQIIPLPVIPTLLVLIILKTGKTLGIRVVPSSWHEAESPASTQDNPKGEGRDYGAGKDQRRAAESR